MLRQLSFILLAAILLTSCGHNVLTNYEVKGLDFSVPIFGYPFGIRVGVVKANQNLIRGDSTYTIHTNTGAELNGTVQETQVIQFSANSQINEGNVEKIIRSDAVSDDVKKAFIQEYLSSQQSPKLLPVSTNTPTTSTATAENPKIHKKQFEQTSTSFWSFSGSSILKKLLEITLNFVLLTTTGKIIALFIGVILVYISIRILYWLVKKIIIYFRR